ncbi:histone H1-like [Oreochromis aureus]|uniref:histone H1-like n=1 Tax=Oreochromis aureus TaxID=47969 RepID=UPI001953C8A3|nr:histone H1-like [Oreochromis aureus]
MTGAASQAPSDSATQAKASGKKKKGGPVVSELVYRAVAASQDRKGLSYYAIKQALSFQGYDVDQHGFLIKHAINIMVKKGALIQTKGSGVSGSFKVPKPGKKPKQALREPALEEVYAAKPSRPLVTLSQHPRRKR